MDEKMCNPLFFMDEKMCNPLFFMDEKMHNPSSSWMKTHNLCLSG
jgi:hypothetical protein